MLIRNVPLTFALVAAAILLPEISAAATPSPKPLSNFGASGPFSGVKHVGDVGGNSASPGAKKKPVCRAKGCKPHAKATPKP
jgi:hypothetical protein